MNPLRGASYYDPGPNFSFHTPANYVPPALPALTPATPILPPLAHHAAPPVHHVPTITQPPVQHQPMPHHAPPAEPLSDDANDLHTSRDPMDVDMQDSTKDSQGTSLSSRATLDILLYGDTDTHMQEPPMP
jgi:hypothetical protein